MTPRARRWAFGAAVLAVAAVAIVPAWLLPGHGPGADPGGPGPGGGASPTGSRPKPTVQGEPATPDRSAEAVAAPDPEVRQRAGAFIRAFLRFEVGDHSRGVEAAIRRLASGRLAHALLATPPHPPSGGGYPPPGELVRFNAVEGTAGGGIEVVALVRYGKRPSPMFVSFERRGGRWLVAAIA